MNLPDKVKTYPDINLAALKAKKHKELRLWYLLKALDPQGSGELPKIEVQKALEGIMSYESFRTLLIAGKGTFWNVVIGRKSGQELIRPVGLVKLAAFLGVEELEDPPKFIPIHAFERLHRFKAYIYGTCFDNNEKPISRALIRKETNLSIPTQISYERTARFKKTKNIRFIKQVNKDTELDDIQKENGFFLTQSEGALYICKRMPNSYLCELPQALIGSMRRANSQLQTWNRLQGVAPRYEHAKTKKPKGNNKKEVYIRAESYKGLQIGGYSEVQLWRSQLWFEYRRAMLNRPKFS